MIKPKKVYLFVHGFVLLVGAIGILGLLFGIFIQIIGFGTIHGLVQFDVDQLIFLPFVFLFIYSGYSTYGLIRKEDFENKWRHTFKFASYSVVFFATIIILLNVITLLATSMFGQSLEGGGGLEWIGLIYLAYLIFFFGSALTIILGIIGFLIDRHHNQ